MTSSSNFNIFDGTRFVVLKQTFTPILLIALKVLKSNFNIYSNT